MFIELTDFDTEEKMLVNMDIVEYIKPYEHEDEDNPGQTFIAGCILSTGDEECLTVLDSYTLIKHMLKVE